MSTACDVKRAPNINCGARRPRLPSMGNVNRINPGSTPCRSAPAPRPRGPCRVAVLCCLKAFEACTGSSVGNRGGGATSASATRAAARPAKGPGGFFVTHPPPRGVAQRKSTGFQTRRLQVRILSPLLDTVPVATGGVALSQLHSGRHEHDPGRRPDAPAGETAGTVRTVPRGPLEQLAAHPVLSRAVTGSSPVRPTFVPPGTTPSRL